MDLELDNGGDFGKRKRSPTAKGAALKVEPTVAILRNRERDNKRNAPFKGLSKIEKADLKTVSAWLFVVVYV